MRANMHDDISFELLSRVETGTLPVGRCLEEIYSERMVKAELELQGFTVGGDTARFCGGADLAAGVFRRLDITRRAVKASGGAYRIIETASDLDALAVEGPRGLLLTIEGAQPCGEDLATLRNFFGLGLRSVCLVWFKANQVGDGVGEERQGGLTNFGREFVREMNQLGMLIDVAQATERTLWDVLETSDQPIVASHSNAAGQHHHVRNLTDEQLRAMADAGGLICMTSYPAHVNAGQPSIDDFVNHLLYAVELVGPEHVALGLNIIGGSPEVEKRFFNAANIEHTNLWLSGLEDIDRLPDLRRRLNDRGLSDSDVSLIGGDNIARVLRSVLPE